MSSTQIIIWFLCTLCVINLHAKNELNKRTLLDSTAHPLCGCYTISLTNVSTGNRHKEMCYTYSIKHNHTLDICEDNEAMNVLLGICDHERPRFKPRKLQKAVISIQPNNYHALSYKPRRNKLTLKIENDIHIISDEEFTLCMIGVNKLGITSNVAQYTVSDGNIVTCSHLPKHIGLPCRSDTNPPIIQPESSNTEDEDDALTDIIYETTSIPAQHPIFNRGYSGKTNPNMAPSETQTDDDPITEQTTAPTNTPTPEPTEAPTTTPTDEPTTTTPTKEPSLTPSVKPSAEPTNNPSFTPSIEPTDDPITTSMNPILSTINNPIIVSTLNPTIEPTHDPITSMKPIHDPITTSSIKPILSTTNNTRTISTINPAIEPTDYPITTSIKPILSTTNTISSSTIKVTMEPTYEPITISTINPILSTTITPSTAPITQTPSTSAPTPSPTADICIIIDQSCGFTDDECDAYLDWIVEFIVDLRDGFYPRVCLLGVSHGVQVFMDLTQQISVMNMIEIIRAQRCGDTHTNLFDALQVAQDKLNVAYPQTERQSIVIFSSCASTNHLGENNEHEICGTFSDNPLIIEIDFYVINVVEGRADVNPYTYLNCLLNGNMERKVIINANNSRNATRIIAGVSDQIVHGNMDEFGHIMHAKAHMMSIIDVMRDDHNHKYHLIQHQMRAFSDSTRNIIQSVFIITVICMVLNALCCTVCALRQSGALDPCFGAIDKGMKYEDELCDVIEDFSELADISGFGDDSCDIADNEDVNMAPHYLKDCNVKIMHDVKGFMMHADIQTPPIIEDDVKLKRCLQVKQSQNFRNIMMNVNDMKIEMKPKLYNQ